jgi:hypothetical protein
LLKDTHNILFRIGYSIVVSLLLFSCSEKKDNEPKSSLTKNYEPEKPLSDSIENEDSVYADSKEDDPTNILYPDTAYYKLDDCTKNFLRVFKVYDKPDDIIILNCYYYRSAHFTLEQEFMFAFEKNDDFFYDQIKLDHLKKVEITTHPFNAGHSWFMPGKDTEYELYLEESGAHILRFYRHLKTGRLYLYGHQW